MFAIEINPNNLLQIAAVPGLTLIESSSLEMYILNPHDWYFIRGYVNQSGHFFDRAILPGMIIEKNFEYDPIKIKTDWDQIVRK